MPRLRLLSVLLVGLFVSLSIQAKGVSHSGLAKSTENSKATAAKTQPAGVQSPKEYLGFAPGDDRKLADWSQIVGYFKQLASNSGKVTLEQPGLTTEQRPFVYALISSEENIKNLPQIREAQRKLADPRLIADAQERERLIHETPAVVAITCSIHSTEIVASQMSMELAYRLVSDNSPETQAILKNTVLLLVPSVNPDGIDIVTNWYRKTLGTKFEGTSPPFLYHHYVGHDDNRDWFMLTQVETQELAMVLWHEWFPEMVYDVHQQGQYGSRMCMPPFFDPPNPNIDPVILREVGEIGSKMALNLTAGGFKGAVTNSTYDTWWHGGLRTAPYYHNEIGILTEAASTNIATPIDIKREQLRAPVRGLANPLVTATNFPLAWEGGTWHNSDILAMELVTTRTALDEASSNHDFMIANYVATASREIETGKTEGPYAYVIPSAQRDYPTAARMMNILIEQGMEIHQARSAFTAGARSYPAGSWVVLMSQPFRANAKCLFEAQHYPDRRLYPGGPAEPPYDVAGWTLPMQMGVDYDQIDGAFQADLIRVKSASVSTQPAPSGPTPVSDAFYVSPDTNNSFLLVNDLLKAPELYRVFRLSASSTTGRLDLHAGGFIVQLKAESKGKGKSAAIASQVADVGKFLSQAESLGIAPVPLKSGQVPAGAVQLRLPRLALYKSWVASMDEGWTRWILEQFGFQYTSITDEDIRSGNLKTRFDVVIIPDESAEQIVKGNRAGSYPTEFTGGIGDAGLANLKTFVESGGTLVCLDTASDLALENFNLPVKNVLEGLRSNQFYAPGSIFRATVDQGSPIAYGMPQEADLYFVSGTRRGPARPPAAGGQTSILNVPIVSVPGAVRSNSMFPLGAGLLTIPSVAAVEDESQSSSRPREPGQRNAQSEEQAPLVSAFAFDITDPAHARSVVRYIDDDPLRSGWLLGPKYIEGKSALVDAEMGRGQVVLIGFRTQHRAQTWGTFKFLFNSIYLGQK